MMENRLQDERAQDVRENLLRIQDAIAEAKVRAGRENEEIHIMAVTKTVPPELVNIAVENGVTLLGENRVQEMLSKYEAYDPRAEVHFIGALQSNKVKYIVDKVTLIHSVDSLKLAREIDKRAAALGRTMDILLEVNVAGEASKSGVSPEELPSLLAEAEALSAVRIRGLMTIPPIGEGAKYFSSMERIFVDMQGKKSDNVPMDILSMGMSDDFVSAVLHGSTLVRIGTRLFGSRK